MSLGTLRVETNRLKRELGLDDDSKRRDAELRREFDMARVEALLGEPTGAAKKREREAAELRRQVDEARVEAALDWKLDERTPNQQSGKSVEHGEDVKALMIQLLSGEAA
jgi:hypothetical protein